MNLNLKLENDLMNLNLKLLLTKKLNGTYHAYREVSIGYVKYPKIGERYCTAKSANPDGYICCMD